MKPTEIAYYYETGNLGSFSKKLMDLFSCADTNNKLRLSIAFPEYAEAYELWYLKPDGWNTI